MTLQVSREESLKSAYADHMAAKDCGSTYSWGQYHRSRGHGDIYPIAKLREATGGKEKMTYRSSEVKRALQPDQRDCEGGRFLEGEAQTGLAIKEYKRRSSQIDSKRML